MYLTMYLLVRFPNPTKPLTEVAMLQKLVDTGFLKPVAEGKRPNREAHAFATAQFTELCGPSKGAQAAKLKAVAELACGEYLGKEGRGEEGEKEAAGAIGQVGPAGAQGNAGDQGPPGSDGVHGADGAVGTAGPSGPVGPAGAYNVALCFLFVALCFLFVIAALGAVGHNENFARMTEQISEIKGEVASILATPASPAIDAEEFTRQIVALKRKFDVLKCLMLLVLVLPPLLVIISVMVFQRYAEAVRGMIGMNLPLLLVPRPEQQPDQQPVLQPVLQPVQQPVQNPVQNPIQQHVLPQGVPRLRAATQELVQTVYGLAGQWWRGRQAGE